MEAYQGTESYEPSADELIDVLKNLENLAALNPALYRAIVDQIKGNLYSAWSVTCVTLFFHATVCQTKLDEEQNSVASESIELLHSTINNHISWQHWHDLYIN